jgi:hypothetical protein
MTLYRYTMLGWHRDPLATSEKLQIPNPKWRAVLTCGYKIFALASVSLFNPEFSQAGSYRRDLPAKSALPDGVHGSGPSPIVYWGYHPLTNSFHGVRMGSAGFALKIELKDPYE